MHAVSCSYSCACNVLSSLGRYALHGALLVGCIVFARQDAEAQVWSVRLSSFASFRLVDLDVEDQGNIYAVGFALGGAADSIVIRGTSSDYGVALDRYPYMGYIARINGHGNADWLRAVHADAFPTESRELIIGTAVVAGYEGPIGVTGLPFLEDGVRFSSGGVSLAQSDPDGDLVWSRTIGSPKNSQHSIWPGYIQGLDVDAVGNVYVTGVFSDTLFAGSQALPPRRRYDSNVFVAKYTVAGNLVWARVVGGHGYLGWGGLVKAAFDVDANGNVYLHGSFRAGAQFVVAGTDTVTLGKDENVLVSLNSGGDTRWVLPLANYAPARSPMFLRVTEDLLGNPRTLVLLRNVLGGGASRVEMARFALDGAFLSRQPLFQGGRYWGVRISDFAIHRTGRVYIAGTFENAPLLTDDFELFSPDNFSDGFVAEYDLGGNLVRVVHVSGSGHQEVTAIAVNVSGELLVGGHFGGSASLGTDTLYAEGYIDAFIANYGSSGLIEGVTEQVDAADPEAVILHPNYPNPFADGTDIGFRLPLPAAVRIRVYDITGRMVDELGGRHFSGGEHLVRFDGTTHPSGLYYYRLTALGQTRVGSTLLVR